VFRLLLKYRVFAKQDLFINGSVKKFHGKIHLFRGRIFFSRQGPTGVVIWTGWVAVVMIPVYAILHA